MIGRYGTGTATVSAGGTTVSGAGTIWTGGNAREGDVIVIGDASAMIVAVVSATELTITPWPGDAETDADYTIYQTSPRRFDSVEVADDLRKQVSALNTTGFYHFVPSSATEPDPSLGDEGQYAFQAITGKMWLKEGGIWAFVGVYKGVNPRGLWDDEAEYAVNDVVSHSGSAYMAVEANVNSEPPSADWMLIAARGDTGAPGAPGTAGAAATIAIGDVTTVPHDAPASVTNSGTSGEAVFNFSIPKGQDGTGTGDMKGANNLSDVDDPDVALDNLGGTTLGKALFTSASSAAVAAAIGTARVARQAVFTSSGTYTPDPNLIFAVVEVLSGGCGGGSVPGLSGQIHSGGGGGSGGYMRHVFSANELSSPQTITIGAGGNGGAAGSNNGTTGGTTLFGSLLAVDGGTGGRYGSNVQVGAGGEGANNFGGSALDATTITVAGAPGGSGFYNVAGANIAIASGFGGSSVLGGGASGVSGGGGVAGKNAPGWGGGGSGGSSNGAASAAGGNGKSGVIIVTEYCSE